MPKDASSLLFILSVAISLTPASQPQSRPPRSVSKPATDPCPRSFHRVGFEGFEVGMRVPGGRSCLIKPGGVLGHVYKKYSRKTVDKRIRLTAYASKRLHGIETSPCFRLGRCHRRDRPTCPDRQNSCGLPRSKRHWSGR